jgi:hypothetical protein
MLLFSESVGCQGVGGSRHWLLAAGTEEFVARDVAPELLKDLLHRAVRGI